MGKINPLDESSAQKNDILDMKVQISRYDRQGVLMNNGKTICTVCNYIFDEQLGEPRQGISPALAFGELPDTWTCPECNSSKDMFQPCSCVSLHIYEMTCVRPSREKAHAAAAETTVDAALLKQPIGQLVAQDPKLACVFEQYEIDYCCGGKSTLEEVLAKSNLPPEGLLQRLKNVSADQPDSSEKDWNKVSLRELTEHIIEAYHVPLRTELARLLKLVNKVAAVHGQAHPEVMQIASVFRSFKEDIQLHMQKEEMILFPGIANAEAGRQTTFGCGGSIDHPIEMMNQEHESAAEALEQMRTLSNNYTPPNDACDTFKVLLHSLASLELEMHQHVHKENNILFPRALSMTKSQHQRCS